MERSASEKLAWVRRRLRAAGVSLLSLLCVALVSSPAPAAEPLKVRVGYGTPPSDITPLLFEKPEILTYYGKTYTVEFSHFRGTSPQIQALAGKGIDLGTLSYTSLAFGIERAGLDVKAVAALNRDGQPGYFSITWGVLEDSPVRSVADLRGKVISTNVIGGGLDIPVRVIMRKHGMEDKRDYRIIEVEFPNNEAMLRERKVDAAVFLIPFWAKARQAGGIRPLFTAADAVGTNEMIMKVARSEWLRQNPEVARQFFSDWVKAWKWFIDPKNRDEALAITARFTKAPVARYKGWAFSKQDLYRDPDALPSLEVLQRNFDLLKEWGYTKTRLNAADYLDGSYVKPR